MRVKLVNELGLTDTLLAAETAAECACHCTWCYVALNRKARATTGTSGANVDTLINRAFSPDYNPTDLVQWGLRNRLPITWASTVEPFQDLEVARGFLRTAIRLNLPLSIQTRGTNWLAMADLLAEHAGQITLFVSLSTLDAAVVRRFEPGAPMPADRLGLLEWARTQEIPAILSLAPYHPDWCNDPAGLVNVAAGLGASAVFWDPLHLSPPQASAASDRQMTALARDVWTLDRTVEHGRAARDAALDHGLAWWAQDWRAPIHGLESVCAFEWQVYRDAHPFGYHHEAVYESVQEAYDECGVPLAVTWAEALGAMESEAAIDQPFAFSSMRSAFPILRYLGDAAKDSLKPAAPLRDYLARLWNQPSTTGFMWKHPFIRYAMREDGSPWRDEGDHLVLVYDPDWSDRKLGRTVPDLAGVRPFKTPRG